MESSQYIERARQLIEGVAGQTLSTDERRVAAIDLTALMLNEARRVQTRKERKQQAQLDRMLDDPLGKAFVTAITDESFRSLEPNRIADQITYLINKFGIPNFLSYFRQKEMAIFQALGSRFPKLFVPLAKSLLKNEASSVILPGEEEVLQQHLEKRRKEGVRVNLNQLGEAILGEKEARKKQQLYISELSRPEVEYLSVKISTLYSQVSLIAWDHTLKILEERLKELYRTAKAHSYLRPNGESVPKFVNLDMEEYRDLHLTLALFRNVLDNPEFFHFSAGIVLQSYLPDSYLIQQELTVWAMQRVANGGSPIKIRIVKGANLAMEKVEASIKGWQQAPYLTKREVDANYKRMLHYAFVKEHAEAVHVGVASHNLFDIAYALLLRSEQNVHEFVEFEMLEGMADHMRRVVQSLSNDILLYCPVAKEKEFTAAVAYLLRRLDENSAKENFLRHLFDLNPGTKEWQNQVDQFSVACHSTNACSVSPRRDMNRFNPPKQPDVNAPFVNESDTDWSLPQNRQWAEQLLAEWRQKSLENIPIIIGGKQVSATTKIGIGKDPSRPTVDLYSYALANSSRIEEALASAKKSEKKWQQVPLTERGRLLAKFAQLLRENRGDLVGAMVADGGKTIPEADTEVSEAIDFVEYYRRNMNELSQMQDIKWKAKGTVLVAPPWNFPCSIPTGGIAAALVAGNCVLFKPALETVYVGWKLVNLFWQCGIEKDVLQFIVCEDEPEGSQLIQDLRLSCVVLTGSTATAKLMLRLRPGVDLVAETGGKNVLIITSMADRDLAIRDLVHSAFGHAGQKCSACSLAICEKEVYRDPHFRNALKDATESLIVGSQWNPQTRVNPLIREPNETLLRGLTRLEKGEEWLLSPKQALDNMNLWSPGIKLGVTEGSFTHQTELFGPVLGIMEANDLEEAVRLANGTPYGLTSGIHSLDDREQKYWLAHIEAGNCYVNRGITGAIVQRQPFGGCKESSFGPGNKAGGPNYVMQMLIPEQIALPEQQEVVNGPISVLIDLLKKIGVSEGDVPLFSASMGSYAFFWKDYFSKEHDPSLVLGQDNILKYVPYEKIVFRVNEQDAPLDILRVIGAALVCGTPIEVSAQKATLQPFIGESSLKLFTKVTLQEETEENFILRCKVSSTKRIRFISSPSLQLKQELGALGCTIIEAMPLANGRVELLHFLREVSISFDYHRYGNLGLREDEVRACSKS